MVKFQAIDTMSDVNPDLKDEVMMTLEILKKLEKPPPPVVEGERECVWNISVHDLCICDL